MPPVEPAATVLARFGGAGTLAQLLRLDRSAVHRWALPKHRGGSGGLIPARHHQRLLAPIGYVPPAEAEAHYYRSLDAQALAA